MRMTKNRKYTLLALEDAGGDTGDPPHSASDVAWTLENSKGYGDFQSLKTIPSRAQIHRTLRELWFEGIIVASRVKQDRHNNLPCWVLRYELSDGAFERVLSFRIADLHRRVNRALNGVAFFGKPFDRGVTPEVAEAMRKEVDDLLARSDDPRLHECRAALDAGLPLPDDFLPKTVKGLRSLMQKHHPDKGGSRAVFEQARAELEKLRKQKAA